MGGFLLHALFHFDTIRIMKRALAVIIVLLLALGMVGLFFPAFVAGR